MKTKLNHVLISAHHLILQQRVRQTCDLVTLQSVSVMQIVDTHLDYKAKSSSSRLINICLSALVTLHPAGRKPFLYRKHSVEQHWPKYDKTTIKPPPEKPKGQFVGCIYSSFISLSIYSFQLITTRCQLTSFSTAVCIYCMCVQQRCGSGAKVRLSCSLE